MPPTSPSPEAAALDAALRAAHGEADSRAMLALHLRAVTFWEDDPDQVAFHRTHAYVYALETGAWDTADTLYAALSAEGRI